MSALSGIAVIIASASSIVVGRYDPVDLARRIRQNVVRMTSEAGASHVASCLSSADIIAVLYADVLDVDPTAPDRPNRDRFILSKGHAGGAIYAALAETGFYPARDLQRYYANGSLFSGHVSHLGIPGVEVSTGALGHGLSIGAGMALNSKRRSLGFRTFVLLSDGECDEGSVWEAAMFSAHHMLGNLVAIVDYNHLQSLTTTHDTLELEPFAAKWRAFGWTVHEVDGHDISALRKVLTVDSSSGIGRPTCVIARTVKGKGVSFMENQVLWHYRYAQGEELEIALGELEA